MISMTTISLFIIEVIQQETALLKVDSDISEVVDEGSMTALIMLDLSAAFDILDHPILLKQLEVSLSFEQRHQLKVVCFSYG